MDNSDAPCPSEARNIKKDIIMHYGFRKCEIIFFHKRAPKKLVPWISDTFVKLRALLKGKNPVLKGYVIVYLRVALRHFLKDAASFIIIAIHENEDIKVLILLHFYL